jgi:hypothetical protein
LSESNPEGGKAAQDEGKGSDVARDKDKIHPFFFHARFEVKTLLQKLDARFEPRIDLVGFPLEKGMEVATPLTDSPFRPDDFRGVEARVAELIPLDPESQVVRMPDPGHGWTDAHEQREQAILKRIRRSALRTATSEAVNGASGNAGFVSYCGWQLNVKGPKLCSSCSFRKTFTTATTTSPRPPAILVGRATDAVWTAR